MYKKYLLIAGMLLSACLIGCTAEKNNDNIQQTTVVSETEIYQEPVSQANNYKNNIATENDIKKIKKSIMETAENIEISAEDYKDAKDVEDLMKKIIEKTN